MTRDEAMTTFRELVRRHGLRWTARDIPQVHWDLLNDCNKVLTEDDRREAIGLPRTRRS